MYSRVKHVHLSPADIGPFLEAVVEVVVDEPYGYRILSSRLVSHPVHAYHRAQDFMSHREVEGRGIQKERQKPLTFYKGAQCVSGAYQAYEEK